MLFSPIEQFSFLPIFKLTFYFYDFTFSNVVLPLFLVLLFSFLILNNYLNKSNLIPKYWQFFFEFFYKFVLDIINQQIGIIGFIYFPFIFTLFIFIFLCNLLSLTPYGFALTSHIIMIFFISFTLFLFVFLVGILKYNLQFFKLFIPVAPFFLLFLLIPIEIFSYFIRAVSLAIRLSANIMAGHTLVFIISSFILNLLNLYYLFAFVFIFLFMILLLEFGIAFLQAYVFVILFCIYLNDSLHQANH